MLQRLFRSAVVAVFFLSLSWASGGDTSPYSFLFEHLDPPSEASRRQLVEILNGFSSEKFRVREQAVKDAAKLPGDALPLLLETQAKWDLTPEVRMRIRNIIPVVRRNAHRMVLEKRREAARLWARRVFAGYYESFCARNAKWDREARKAFRLIAARYVDSPELTPTYEESWKACRVALDAGCPDPVLRLYAAMYDRHCHKPGLSEYLKRYVPTVRAIEKSPAPAFVKAIAFSSYFRVTERQTFEEVEDARRWFELLKKSVLIAARDKGISSETLGDLVAMCAYAARRQTDNWREERDRLLAALAEALPEGSSLPIVFGVKPELMMLWDEFGRGGCKHTESFEAGQLIKEWGPSIERRLTDAWKMDPSCAFAPAMMIELATLRSDKPDVVEKWFQRAMVADSLSWDAHWNRIRFGLTGCQTVPSETCEYAQKVACSAAPDTPLVLLLKEVKDWDLRWRGRAHYTGEWDYWDGLKMSLERYLKAYPYDQRIRTEFARYAMLEEDYVTAHRLFTELGDQVAKEVFDSCSKIKRMRTRAALLSCSATGQLQRLDELVQEGALKRASEIVSEASAAQLDPYQRAMVNKCEEYVDLAGRFRAGEWIDLPLDPEHPIWTVRGGDWTREDEGIVCRGEAMHNRLVLGLPCAGVEVTGEMEALVDSGATNAAFIFGFRTPANVYAAATIRYDCRAYCLEENFRSQPSLDNKRLSRRPRRVFDYAALGRFQRFQIRRLFRFAYPECHWRQCSLQLK